MTALTGELGEAANVIKKLNRIRSGININKETQEELQQQLKSELGDTFIYLDLLCQSLGYSIGEASIEAFNTKSIQLGFPHRIGDMNDHQDGTHKIKNIADETEPKGKAFHNGIEINLDEDCSLYEDRPWLVTAPDKKQGIVKDYNWEVTYVSKMLRGMFHYSDSWWYWKDELVRCGYTVEQLSPQVRKIWTTSKASQ
jgi:NTP pyrophosphatase (non-canonical NTP hydrolase)